MLRLFKIEGGLIQEIKCDHAVLGDHLVDADWIDAHEPDEEERALLQRMLRTELPESDEVEEIEASARCFVDQAGVHVHSLFLTTLERQLHAALPRRLEQSRERLEALARELNAVSPLAVLGRGYAILEDDERHIVRHAHDTQPGQTLTARLGEGRLKVEVKRRFKR